LLELEEPDAARALAEPAGLTAVMAPTPATSPDPLADPAEELEDTIVPALTTATPSTKSDRLMFFMFF
jgi:hypothetical protein